MARKQYTAEQKRQMLKELYSQEARELTIEEKREMLKERQRDLNSASIPESMVRGFAQGATLGYADEISGAVESLFKTNDSIDDLKEGYKRFRDESRANFAKAEKDNPKSYMASEIAGGLGTFVIPGANAMKGASLAQVAKHGTKLGALTGYGYSEADNLPETAMDVATGAATGYAAPHVLSKTGKAINKHGRPALKKLANLFETNLEKPNAIEISEAAERLNIKPTPAMLSNDESLQRLEEAIGSGTRLLSRGTQRKRQAVVDGLNDKAKEFVDGTIPGTPYQYGEQFKTGIRNEVEGRLQPAIDGFEKVAKDTRFIDVSPNAKRVIVQNIKNMDEYRLLGGGGKIGRYVNAIESVENANQLKTLGTLLRKDIQSAEGAEKYVLTKIQEKVRRLEENSIFRAATEMTEIGGDEVGKELVDELLGARARYGKASREIREIGNMNRVRGENAQDVLGKIDDIPSAKITDRFFKSDNVEAVYKLKETYPEQFEILKQSKLRDLADSINGVAMGTDGKPQIAKFLKEVRRLTPEVQQLLFDDSLPVIRDLETLYLSLPKNYNPSGTAAQSDIFMSTYDLLKDGVNLLRYKFLSGKLNNNVADRIAKLADKTAVNTSGRKLNTSANTLLNQRMAGLDYSELVNAITAEDTKDLKGPSKWVVNGYIKLRKHDPGISNKVDLEKLLQSDEGRDILMKVNDVRADSKAFSELLKKVRREMKIETKKEKK